MSYFTMSKFLRKEDLYKAKAEYLESALKEIVDAHEIDDSVWQEGDLWVTVGSSGGLTEWGVLE